ncbi:MAG: hypothetical protein GY737_16855 [Desulfobacteraceae bacterium]|nr:hypothetical protein [Desulfobacteraceae bacterium]
MASRHLTGTITVGALPELLPKIKETFIRLDESEQCVYLALFKSVKLADRLKRDYPSRTDLIQTCQEVCPNEASEHKLNTIINRLLKKGVLKEHSK